MAASTVPAAKAALLALLAARPALAGVEMRWGIPARLPSNPERVYVGDATDLDREWAALGAQRLEESYTLQVTVETFGSGDDERATEERLWVLVNEVELAVRGDLTLTGTVRVARPDGATPTTGPTDEGWLARAVVRVACEARI